MKLKFRADSHDLLIFGIFSIFLLYVVALAVINLKTFAATGELYGLNPFPASGPEYIVTTITFYFIALGALFASVSSYFFEREKGFGLTTEKKDKGYSRWAKAKEIKAASLIIDNTKMTMTPIVQSLEVDVSEGKTTFNFGDQFSSEGIKIYVIYSNGDKYQIENSQCVFEGFDNESEGKQIITVSYENVSTTYQIEVNRVPSYLN